MKITNRAKKAWFKKYIIDFRIYYRIYQAASETKVYMYDIMRGVTSSSTFTFLDLFLDEQKSLWVKLHKLKPWEVFFKYRHKFQKYNPKLQSSDFYFEYTRHIEI